MSQNIPAADINAGCSPATAAVRAGIDRDPAYGAVTPPLVLSSNFSFAGFAEKRSYDYTRSGNPTRDLLGEALADLEGGAGGVVTATGMAAITLVLNTLLQPGDVLVVPHDCYGGSWRLFNALANKGAFTLATCDLTDPRALGQALERGPALVWIETPSNPLLRITDLEHVVGEAKAAGARVLVDNTFLSPLLQQPLALGDDIVVHSTTKYINGHSDVVGGAVIAKTPELAEQLAWWGNCLGHTGGAFDAYLTLRGLRTLAPRLRQHQENAAAIIGYLQSQSLVSKIYHPSLPSHPGHEIAKRQQQGFGAMLSFEASFDLEQMKRFLGSLELFCLAESLGGVESLVAHPASMTHAGMDPQARRVAGISDQLLRLSVGIEHAGDLIHDLDQAFKQAVACA